jgi:hypothetical protein
MSLGQRIRSATKIFAHKPTREKSSDQLNVHHAAPTPAVAHPPTPASPSPVLGPPGQLFKKCIDPNAQEVPKIMRACVEYIERAGTSFISLCLIIYAKNFADSVFFTLYSIVKFLTDALKSPQERTCKGFFDCRARTRSYKN